jgi:hypothetical protein
MSALGISIHTGWAACVVVRGSLARPEIVAHPIIHLLDDAERFVFHMAAEMERAAAANWVARAKKKATAAAKRALAPLVALDVKICALVARDTDPGDLDFILAAHPRLHTAEGCLYRDALRDACPVPVTLVAPKSLDISTIGKIAPPPWGKDQKLALAAAFAAM